MTYDPDLIDRLVREAREDDERMTRRPWLQDSESRTSNFRYVHVGDADGPGQTVAQWLLPGDADAIARTRNNLTAMADQLEAARREVERLVEVHAHAAGVIIDEQLLMRPVVDAAEQWRSNGHGAAATLVLVSAIDAYRAAKGNT